MASHQYRNVPSSPNVLGMAHVYVTPRPERARGQYSEQMLGPNGTVLVSPKFVQSPPKRRSIVLVWPLPGCGYQRYITAKITW